MKKSQKIISSIVFVVLLTAAIVKCADILEYKEARKKYTPFYESETNFDVIFLGTSHMWNHVLPMEMWDMYGIASYNWGYSNCTPAENYYLIQDILKYTSPKVVVMDVYGLTEYDDSHNGKYQTDRIEQQHVQFDSLPVWSLNKAAAAKDVFDDYDSREDFIWNFIMYHNRWTELGQSDFDYDITTEKGSYFITGLGTGTFTPIPEKEKTEIDSVCYPYYLNLIKYCEEKGIQVLCAYIPFAAGKEQQRIANTIGDIVEEYPNCDYINMLTKDILNFDTDLCPDNEHLNYSGARKVTKWLGRYLSENYKLDDYSGNHSWMSDYQSYYDYKVKTLKEQTTLTDYLVQLADDDFVAEAEVYDKKLMNSERLMLLYENANIEPEFSATDQKCCAKLKIYSAETKERIEEVTFVCDNAKNPDIFHISKVIEQ